VPFHVSQETLPWQELLLAGAVSEQFGRRAVGGDHQRSARQQLYFTMPIAEATHLIQVS
jgi:hypothetical protein